MKKIKVIICAVVLSITVVALSTLFSAKVYAVEDINCFGEEDGTPFICYGASPSHCHTLEGSGGNYMECTGTKFVQVHVDDPQ